MLEVKRKPIVRRKRVLMSEDLRTDHVKLESPSILTKKILFLPGHWGGGGCPPPCLRQCLYFVIPRDNMLPRIEK